MLVKGNQTMQALATPHGCPLELVVKTLFLKTELETFLCGLVFL